MSMRSRSTPPPLKPWDDSTNVTTALCQYNSLRDRALANFYGKASVRSHLISSGIVTPDGRIVHCNRAFGRVIIAEKVFDTAEREEEQHRAQEYQLRLLLKARAAASREKALKDKRVNKVRSSEHQSMAQRRQKHNSSVSGRRSPTSNHTESQKPKVDWDVLKRQDPESFVVEQKVVSPPPKAQQKQDDSDDEYSDDYD